MRAVSSRSSRAYREISSSGRSPARAASCAAQPRAMAEPCSGLSHALPLLRGRGRVGDRVRVGVGVGVGVGVAVGVAVGVGVRVPVRVGVRVRVRIN